MSRLVTYITGAILLWVARSSPSSELLATSVVAFAQSESSRESGKNVDGSGDRMAPQRLIVWTRPACGPCVQFWRDLATDAAFRSALCERFDIHWADPSACRAAADARGIRLLPTFDLGARRVEGYQGKRWLWRELTAVSSADSQSAPPRGESVTERESDLTARPIVPLPPLLRAPRSTRDAAEEGPPPPASAPTSPSRLSQDASTGTGQRGNNTRRESRAPLNRRLGETLRRSVPLVLTGLELAGVVGGTAATGGAGTIAVATLWRSWKRRRRMPRAPGDCRDDGGRNSLAGEEEPAVPRAPFPRRLDEARELLALRQSEGRVATLDALRGMFLDDELRKLATSLNEDEASLAAKVKAAINVRVDEVAPLSTTID
ncbi:MAG: hypothetical protein KF861_14595 [Planctomycetaceae bacterium]|nr:hypothetical protein [Planctomycetaceae bacterium]